VDDANLAGGTTSGECGTYTRRLLPVKNFLIALTLPIVAIAAYAVGWYFPPPTGGGGGAGVDVSTGPATEPKQVVTALGRIEPSGGVVVVAGPPGDVLETLKVSVNDTVEEDAPLAILRSHEARLENLTIVKSRKEEAVAMQKNKLAEANARKNAAILAGTQTQQYDSQINLQKMQIELLKQAHQLQLSKQQSLQQLSPRLVTQQELTAQNLLVEKAAGELAAANKQLELLDEQKTFAEKKSAQELAAAHIAIEAASRKLPASLDAAIRLAEQQLEASILKAPVAGRILHIHTVEGEPLAAKPVLQMANLDDMIVRVEVHQDDVKKVRPGQRATMTSEALPAEAGGDEPQLTGNVVSVEKYIAPPGFHHIDARFQRPGEIVVVKIALSKEGLVSSNALAQRLVNLELQVTIDVSGL